MTMEQVQRATHLALQLAEVLQVIHLQLELVQIYTGSLRLQPHTLQLFIQASVLTFHRLIRTYRP